MAPRRRQRAQAHTLESLAASLVVVLGLLFALQVTIVTPLAASTANEHIGNQLQGASRGMLSIAADHDSLRPTLLYWNDTAGSFHGAVDLGYYATGGPPTAFGANLNRTFGGPDVAFNVNLVYLSESGDRTTRPLVHFGTPADDAVTAARTVTLYDGDRLLTAAGDRSSTELSEATTYFAPDVAPDSPVYNVVEIEVVVWQM